MALVLDSSSHSRLLAWWEGATGTTLLPRKYAHHTTLKFGPSEEDMKRLPIGEKASVQVVGWAANAKGQAVVIKGLESATAIPHITVAMGGSVPPQYSNNLLAKGYERVSGPRLTGTVLGQERSK